MNGTIVYREINPSNDILINWLEERGQIFNVVDNKGRERVYVDNDQPRDWEITPLIVEDTVGFALFTNDGEYIAEYRSLDRALKAQSKAKITVVADVGFDDEDAEDEEAPDTKGEDSDL